MSTFVNIYVLSFNFFQHLYIFEFQVFSGCFPHYIMKMLGFVRLLSLFYICPVFFFIVGKISFFIVGKYSKFLLLRSRFVLFFYGLQNLQILTASAPLQVNFSRLSLGFLLASFSTSSRVQYCFSRASLVLRSHSSLTVNFCIFSLFALCSFFCSASVR